MSGLCSATDPPTHSPLPPPPSLTSKSRTGNPGSGTWWSITPDGRVSVAGAGLQGRRGHPVLVGSALAAAQAGGEFALPPDGPQVPSLSSSKGQVLPRRGRKPAFTAPGAALNSPTLQPQTTLGTKYYHLQFEESMGRSKLICPHHRFIESVQFSHSVVSDSLQPRGLQHARPPCPSPTPVAYPNTCPLSR